MLHKYSKQKGKAIPLRGRRGPLVCKTSRLPYFLDNRFADGGEGFSLMRRLHFTPKKISDTHVSLEAESTPGS
jgi:hypothetical protein